MYKIFLTAFILTFGTFASASEGAQALYEALQIEPQNACTSPVCPNALQTLKKKLTGLECSETTYMSAGQPADYSCSVFSNVDAKQVYEALNVKAKDACNSAVCPNSEVTLVKKLKSVICSETTTMSPQNPVSYKCVFNF